MALASKGINNKIKWGLKFSFSGDKQHSLLYRSKFMGKGIQMEIHTPKRKNGTFGNQKVSFFIDGDRREFRTQEALIQAIKEL